MSRLITIIGVCAVLALGGWAAVKYTATGRVAWNKITGGVNDAVDPSGTEIPRQKIAMHVKKLEDAIDQLQTQQYTAEEEAKTQKAYIKTTEGKISEAKHAMKVVEENLTTVAASKKAIMIGNKEYTEPELVAIGDKLVTKYKALSENLGVQKATLDRIQTRASKFKDRGDELKKELDGLKVELNLIDEKLKEYNTLQKAAAEMGDADKTVGDNLEQVKKSISDLKVKVDVRLNKEDRAWDKVGKSGDETEKFIQATKPAPDTLSDIDAILKGKK